MSGWLLIIALLVLGGVLSALGDRLGSRVGKARLSLFNMRPRRTAVLITVLTGSLISALSLGLMLLVSSTDCNRNFRTAADSCSRTEVPWSQPRKNVVRPLPRRNASMPSCRWPSSGQRHFVRSWSLCSSSASGWRPSSSASAATFSSGTGTSRPGTQTSAAPRRNSSGFAPASKPVRRNSRSWSAT